MEKTLRNSQLLSIKILGWIGIIIGIIAIYKRDIYLFLIWQLAASIFGFFQTVYLQKKYTYDVILSLVITTIAVFSKDQFTLYASMLIRSISYQLIFHRLSNSLN
jgi:hypothetical protein